IVETVETGVGFNIADEFYKTWKLTPAVEALLLKYKEDFEIVDRAIELPYSQGPLLKSPGDRIPNYVSLRNLAALRLALARLDCEKGNIDKALKTVKDMMEMGRIMEMKEGGSTLIGIMISVAARGLALETLNWMLSNGYIPSNDLVELNRFLTKHRFNSEAFKNAWKVEYTVFSTIISDIGRQRHEVNYDIGSDEWFGFVGRAMSNNFIRSLIFKRNLARKMIYDHYEGYVENSDKPFSEMKFEEIPIMPESLLSTLTMLLKGEYGARVIAQIAIPNYTRSFGRTCYYEFILEGTRLRLAAFAYKHDHGALPRTLQELVPNYIDNIPIDSFDGNPIRYNPAKKVIYSVGTNLTDENGTANEFVFTGKGLMDLEKDIVIKIE
ncbi:MAG: hypothetical protein AB1546_04805, partial [bacterium]